MPYSNRVPKAAFAEAAAPAVALPLTTMLIVPVLVRLAETTSAPLAFCRIPVSVTTASALAVAVGAAPMAEALIRIDRLPPLVTASDAEPTPMAVCSTPKPSLAVAFAAPAGAVAVATAVSEIDSSPFELVRMATPVLPGPVADANCRMAVSIGALAVARAPPLASALALIDMLPELVKLAVAEPTPVTCCEKAGSIEATALAPLRPPAFVALPTAAMEILPELEIRPLAGPADDVTFWSKP